MGIALVFVTRRLPRMMRLGCRESSGLIRVRRSLTLPASALDSAEPRNVPVNAAVFSRAQNSTLRKFARHECCAGARRGRHAGLRRKASCTGS
jgi:hypothetical protein